MRNLASLAGNGDARGELQPDQDPVWAGHHHLGYPGMAIRCASAASSLGRTVATPRRMTRRYPR